MHYPRDNAPRVLMIAPYPVLPPSTGGKIRIVELARHLSRTGFDVWVLTPYKPGQRDHHCSDFGFKLREVAYPFLLPLLLTDKPFPYGYLVSFHPGFASTLRQFLHSFDAFQFEHVFFADLAAALPPGRPIVYDAHNVEYDYVRSECTHAKVREIAGKRIFRMESELVARASRLLVCSDRERRRFTDLYGVPEYRLSVTPNGIQDILSHTPTGAEEALKSRFPGLSRFKQYAVYTGSDVEHNREAVRLIIDCFAPQLQDECAFIIHGTVANAFRNQKFNNVYFDSSYGGLELYSVPQAIGLNPVTQGAGTNLKLIQYLAHRLPVVSTEFGVRGYDDLRQFVTVRPINRFVEAIRSQPHLDAAVLPLLQRYVWGEIGSELSQTYFALLEENCHVPC